MLVVVGLIAAFVAFRRGQRMRTLSPGVQDLLRSQPWRKRVELSSWRPIFWFIPSPVWLIFSLIALAAGIAGPDAALLIGGAVGTAVFGVYSRRWWQDGRWRRPFG
jgi:hypothetical protein